jgi:hypothetical protein
VALDLGEGRNHYLAEVSLKKKLVEAGIRRVGVHTWYSVFKVTTAASWALTIVSHARMTPSFVSVESLSARSSRIKLPWSRYNEYS